MEIRYFISYKNPYSGKLSNNLQIYKILGENIVGPLPGVVRNKEELDYYYYDVTSLIPKEDAKDRIATGEYEDNILKHTQKGIIDDDGHISLEPPKIDHSNKIFYLLPVIAEETSKMNADEKHFLKGVFSLIPLENDNYTLRTPGRKVAFEDCYYKLTADEFECFLKENYNACLECKYNEDETFQIMDQKIKIK